MTTPSKVDTLSGPSTRREERKVLAGTLVGSKLIHKICSCYIRTKIGWPYLVRLKNP